MEKTKRANEIYNAPVFFERNRVFRVYLGGKLFHDFFGDEAKDGNYPEEWVASAVHALNKNTVSEKEGISKIADSDLYFDDLLKKYPKETLGDRKNLGVLVKLLDSAIRLPAQAHPDKAFSRKYFNSEYGKAESWVILATRDDACIYFGFKEGVTLEDLKRTIAESETDGKAFEKIMIKIPVKVGDAFFIPAKHIHAIGAGCLLLEAQEPTDFTIQPERLCGDYRLADEEMYLNIDKTVALECFDVKYTPAYKKTPEIIEKGEGYIYEGLITPADTPCFTVNRLMVNGAENAVTFKKAPAIYVVTDGEGKIIGENYEKNIKKGDYFFLPFAADGKFAVKSDNITLIECMG